MGTRCHDRPFVGVDAVVFIVTVARVVEVGQTQCVAELMAHGTDTLQDAPAGVLIAVKLGGAGVVAQSHSVLSHGGAVCQAGLVWPKIVRVVALDIRRQAGEDDVDDVDLAVTIVVIVGKVHQLVGCRAGILDELRTIATGFHVGLRAVDGYRSHDVELRTEHPHAVVVEIVVHAACEDNVFTDEVAVVAFIA